MNYKKPILYRWNKINWYIENILNPFSNFEDTKAVPVCPNPACHCYLVKSTESYSIGEYKYKCINCNFKITLDKSIEEKTIDFLKIKESFKFKNAEIINIDGELIKIKNEHKTDDDYWVDVKISKNKKNEVQLMILAGSKKNKDKTQLFLEPKNEKLTFDQNNDHPLQVFTKVVAKFKNSSSEIKENKKPVNR